MLVCFMMALTSMCFAKEFTDLSRNHWAYPVIQEMTKEGILSGYPDGTFKPNGEITRAEFAKILATTFELENHEAWPYDDIYNHWAKSYIESADWYMREKESFNVPHLPDGTNVSFSIIFSPNAGVTRNLAALSVIKASNLQDETPDLSVLNGFKDKDDIKNYREYVALAVKHGFMKGNANGTFNPNGSLTRAEVCQLLYNVRYYTVSNQVSDEPEVVPSKQEEEKMTESDFATSFLKEENKGKNLIYSPLSIKYALKMLEEGANGNTKKQIETVVGGLKATKYAGIENVLSLANGLFIKNDFEKDVKRSYTDTLKQKYDAEIKYDSFQSVDALNAWIENKTMGLLKNVLQPGSITPSTVMALMNALAIQMDWESSFDTANTWGREFTKEDGTKIQATTMHKNAVGDSEAYYIDDDVTALRMNLKKYDDVQLEFIALMPTSQTLSEYAKEFSLENLDKIEGQMKTKKEVNGKIEINIPKFKYNVKLDNFKEDLQKLGVVDAFSALDADFSNMSDVPLSVDQAIHQAMIDFSEKGIKAAAVTVFMIKANGMFMEPEEIHYVTIDHPFLFVIRDKETKETWFIGTMYEPNLWEQDKAEYTGKW